MRVRKAYIAVLILSLLIVDESSPFLLRPASAKTLFSKSFWLRIFKALRTLNFSKISKALDKLRSFLHSNGGSIARGVVVEGLSIVKDYLDLFGFLDSASNANSTDEFSADLESAIKFFQKTFQLNVTGQPDNATVSMITLPRCGLPDVINGSSTLPENHTTSFTKWRSEGKKELTYAFSPENETGIFMRELFAGAFRRWSEVTRLNFTETTSFNECDIQITFLSLDGSLGVVGGAWVDNTTRNWDVVLDSDEKWMFPSENMTGNNELDLESVAMHHIGHVLGLNHSAMQGAVMYPFFAPSNNNRKVDFAEDDLDKIRQLYSTKSKSNSSKSGLAPVQSPLSKEGGVPGVGPRWGLVSTLWLGIIWLFWF
ncbi:metalloendoproteinase 1-like [Neltuma alba]|uniref:metalloendoproteinase 1-like n=1 Tax=Neltuma alba TaxID=207710 RepID=UPI0010A42B60|nr:metalloendoproteinase 1-like [Prosopis alba]